MSKTCKISEQDRKMAWIAFGTILLLAMAKKTNEAMLQWYDRGLETLEIIVGAIG